MEHYPYFQHLVGLTLTDARDLVKPQGLTVRASRINGSHCELKSDHNPNRLNVCIVNNLISKVDYRG